MLKKGPMEDAGVFAVFYVDKIVSVFTLSHSDVMTHTLLLVKTFVTQTGTRN